MTKHTRHWFLPLCLLVAGLLMFNALAQAQYWMPLPSNRSATAGQWQQWKRETAATQGAVVMLSSVDSSDELSSAWLNWPSHWSQAGYQVLHWRLPEAVTATGMRNELLRISDALQGLPHARRGVSFVLTGKHQAQWAQVLSQSQWRSTWSAQGWKVRGLALIGVAPQSVLAGSWSAAGDQPLSILLAPAEESAASSTDAVLKQIKTRGHAVTWVPSMEWSTGLSQADTILAWLNSANLRRLQRVEQWSLQDAAVSSDARWPRGAIEWLVAGKDAMLAAIQPASPKARIQLWWQPDTETRWRPFAQLAGEFRRVTWMGELPIDSAIGRLPLLMLSAERADGSAQWFYRDGLSLQPLNVGRAVTPAITTAVVANNSIWLGTKGRGAGVFRAQLVDRNGVPQLQWSRQTKAMGDVTGLVANADMLIATLAVNNQSNEFAKPVLIHHRFNETQWNAVPIRTGARWLSAAHSPLLVPRQDANSSDVVVVDSKGGQILRWTPGTRQVVVELAYRDGLAAHWQSAVSDATLPSSWMQVAHPQSNDEVQVLGLSVRKAAASQNAQSVYLVRELDGQYSLGLAELAGDAAAMDVRGLAMQSREHRWWIGGVNSDGFAQLRAVQAPASREPRAGLWWNQDQSGTALGLFPLHPEMASDKWIAVYFGYDANGQSTWWSATGVWRNGAWQGDAGGLVQWRRMDAQSTALAEAAKGKMQLRLLTEHDAACPNTGADGVNAMAVDLNLAGEHIVGCWQPFQFGPTGRAAHNANGLWYGGANDSGWGLVLEQQGVGAALRETALLLYFDSMGAARWALAAGDGGLESSVLDWNRFTRACADCKPKADPVPIGMLEHRSVGFCGQRQLEITTVLKDSNPKAKGFVKQNQRLKEFSEAVCY